MSSQGAAELSPQSAGAHQLECKIVTSLDALEKISGQWDRLAAKDTVFQRFGWFRAFVHAYSSRVQVFTPVVSEGDTIIGILPLVRCGKTVKFTSGDYNDIIAVSGRSGEVLSQCFHELLKAQRLWHECVFENVPETSRMARHVADLPADIRHHVQVSFRYPCPTMVVDGSNAGELRKLAQKKDIRRQQNRLQHLGPLAFRHLNSREAILARLPEFFQQHIQRRAVLGQKSRFLDQDARTFYENLVMELDPRGTLRFSVLEVGSNPVAFHLGFEYNQTFLRFTSVFDVDYLAYSPGEVLLGRLLNYADERGVREFDFGIGGEDYKRRFSNHIKQNLAIYLDRGELSPQYIRRRVIEVARRTKEKAQQKVYVSRHSGGIVRALLRFATDAGGTMRAVGGARWADNLFVAACHKLFSHDDIDVLVSSAGVRAAKELDSKVVPATLGVLGMLALEHPELRSHLREFADRLKNGDRVYISQPQGGPVALAWIGNRTEICIPAHDPIDRIRLDKPADVLYDYWASALDSSQQREFLNCLAHYTWAGGRELWVLARHGLNLRQAIPELEFQLKHRFTRTRIFGMTHTAVDAHKRRAA